MERIKQRAKLIRPLLIPLVLYIGALVIMVSYMDAAGAVWKWIIALLPVLPMIWIVFGVINAINQLDELERRIMLEAAVFSLLITTLGLTAFGLLKQVGVEQPSAPYIILFMMFMWLVGKLLGNRKYR